MGRIDLGDRVARAMVAIAALAALANGAFMLSAPLAWYDAVGTVRATGPANAHFLRDIGIAYLVSGALLSYGAANLALRWGAALAGAAWLTLHGLLHVWEVSKGICSTTIFWQEFPATLGLPLLALIGIAIPLARVRFAPAPLPKAMFVGAFDRMTDGTSPFIHDLAAAGGFAVEKFQHFMPVTMHRHHARADLLHMARIGATLVEDCGPCALLSAKGALADGVTRDAVNAALIGTPPEGAPALAFAFGRAVAANDPEVGVLGDAVESAHGRAVRTELALAAATVRTYPALKRGLGYAQACSTVRLAV
ncbi:hypothetical protein [Novosphingobium sp.]|uniref:hypothetical protein n=1 Tax=Novosphingobium sp. TaxID=1874826 RepID=UPI0025DDFAFB|nr:hypothetical protein [Novosphingobium sp.]